MIELNGIEKVKVYDRFPNLDPGVTYDVELIDIKGFGSSVNANVKINKVLSGESSLKPGDKARVLLTKHPKYPSYFFKTLVFLGSALSGIAASKVGSKDIDYLLSDEQPATGVNFRIKTVQKVDADGNPKTYSSGDPILDYTFSGSN